MLTATKTANEKRKAFRAGLKSGKIQRFPGVFAPLVAMLAEELGFEGCYISGAVMSTFLGVPDIGLTTLTEVSEIGSGIARSTNLPSFIDADTGFGEPMSAARTIRVFEDLGLSGCHLEDQVNPKRCGHLDNKAVVTRDDMVKRIRAAASARRDSDFVICARTDARGVEGLDAAIDRAKAYIDAGADMIFPEAMADLKEFEAFRKGISVPMLANMTEFGKSELFSAKQLESVGVNLVIYPVTSWRLAMGAIEDGFKAILKDGHQNNVIDRMQTRKRLYELVRYEDYNDFDTSIFNFKV